MLPGGWDYADTVPVVSVVSGRKTNTGIYPVSWKGAAASVFGLLVIYRLKDVEIMGGSHGVPEFLSIAAVVVLHRWKRQMLLSVAGGTAFICCLYRFCSNAVQSAIRLPG